MVSIEVLVTGYSRERQDGWEANATTTLITTENRCIVVDPGMDRSALCSGLERKALEPADITDVFVTHFHIDHTLNISVFPQARLVDGACFIFNNGGIFHSGQPFGEGIFTVPTPGHDPGHTSLSVFTQEKWYYIAGDVIWYPAQTLEEVLDLPDPYAYNNELLLRSRQQVWQAADVIIPGHGPLFSPG
jgi:glyoxylase-like metal-dependent hydrolase (beta-lactamase superfamily II)